MPEVARATVTIIPNMQGSQKKIAEDLGASTGSAGESAGKSFGGKLIGALGKIGIGAAVAKIVKDSVGEGAKLQQSFGGLDTLYGDASEAAKNYAKEAWAAGISTNDYAEQAVSFGAALKKAFGGDTAKAAEAANTAIMDMADNAAKMGTPIESIQEAYQGFAKGQYQLLDNLAIGYGGTKGEMERLLADATKLSGVEYNIDNLGDVYEAIHVIQKDLGLTGVAAAEASTTFSGSFGAMKAAASNLLASMSLGEDIGPSLAALGTSVKTFIVGNLFPMIGSTLASLPTILAAIPGFVADLLPDLLVGAADILAKLAQSIVNNIPTFIAGIGSLAMAIPNMLMNIDWGGVASSILSGLSGAIGGIWDSVAGMLTATFGIEMPDWNTVLQNITDLWENVKSGITEFFKAAFDIVMDDDKTVIEKISALWDLVSSSIADLFKAYFNLVIPAYETIVGAISNWWGTNVWPGIQDFFKTTFGIDLPDWNTLVKPIEEGWNTIKDTIAAFIQSPFSVIMPVFDDIVEDISTLWDSVWEGISGFFKSTFSVDIPSWEDIKGNIETLWNDFKAGISGFFQTVFRIGIPIAEGAISAIETLWNSVKAGIGGFFKAVFELGIPLVSGIVSKLSELWDKVVVKIGDLFNWLFNLKFPDIDTIVADLKTWWDGVVKGIGDFFTLKWIFDKDQSEEDIEHAFSGGGSSFEINNDNVNIDSDAIQQALDSANLKLSDIDTSSLDKAKEAVTSAISSMESAFSSAKMALPTILSNSLATAYKTIRAKVGEYKAAMNFSWTLPSLHGHLPIISVAMRSASSSDGRTHVSYPELSVSGFRWFAQGGIFNSPQIIGIGDSKGPEAAVPLDQMWKRMSAEFDKHMNGGAVVNNYFTVDGAQDPEAWAIGAARTIQRELRMA